MPLDSNINSYVDYNGAAYEIPEPVRFRDIKYVAKYFPECSFEPKVYIPFKVQPGQCPRKLAIERYIFYSILID